MICGTARLSRMVRTVGLFGLSVDVATTAGIGLLLVWAKMQKSVLEVG